jgi:hypothetical protein
VTSVKYTLCPETDIHPSHPAILQIPLQALTRFFFCNFQVREIVSLWHTDELRRTKPSSLDEARGGLHIVEQSLWKAVPAYLRRVSNALKKVRLNRGAENRIKLENFAASVHSRRGHCCAASCAPV